MFDEFEREPVKYRGIRYDCNVHAQWSIFLSRVGLAWRYKPERFTHEWLGTERYNPGSKSRFVHYEPAFYVEDLGWWDITNGAPDHERLQLAERLAFHKQEPVYLVQDAPEIPGTHHTCNPVTIVRGLETIKRNCRMQHNGRRFYVGIPTKWFYVHCAQIQDAAAYAELLQVRNETAPTDGRETRA